MQQDETTRCFSPGCMSPSFPMVPQDVQLPRGGQQLFQVAIPGARTNIFTSVRQTGTWNHGPKYAARDLYKWLLVSLPHENGTDLYFRVVWKYFSVWRCRFTSQEELQLHKIIIPDVYTLAHKKNRYEKEERSLCFLFFHLKLYLQKQLISDQENSVYLLFSTKYLLPVPTTRYK